MSLEPKYADEPPYRAAQAPGDLPNWLRLGVFNRGPLTATDVKGFLLSIEPNPLPDYLLPSRLGWKGGGAKQNIPKGHERQLDILAFRVVNDELVAQFWISEGPAICRLYDGRSYLLRVQLTAINAKDSTTHEYLLERRGAELCFSPATIK